MSGNGKNLPVVGWHGLVSLPGLGLTGVPAKIDSSRKLMFGFFSGCELTEFEPN